MQEGGFIEVVGEAQREIGIAVYLVTVTIGATTDADSADPLDRLKRARAHVIETLQTAGIEAAHIVDCGLDLGYQRRRGENHPSAGSSLRVRCKDLDILYRALAQSKQAAVEDGCALALRWNEPEFDEFDRGDALNQAVRNARTKAEAIAKEAGGRLGTVMSVVELPPGRRSSGTLGDPDYWGDQERFQIGSSRDFSAQELGSARRVVWVFARTRFALIASGRDIS